MQTLSGLSPSLTREIYASLCAMLPPPVTDTAEDRADRDEWAMQSVAVLRPADAFEARLAVDAVAADAHAKDSLRLAAKFFNDVTLMLRCRAQFAVMMRQMQSALRTLQRMQAARQKADAAPSLGVGHAIPDPETSQPAPQPDPLAGAEDYAVLYPLFAARIRAQGGLPADMTGFDPAIAPPAPAIVETLVHGTSPLLCALDQMGHDLAQAA